MKKLSILTLAVALFALSAVDTFGQQKISPEKETLIKELLEVSGTTKNAREISKLMTSFQETEAANMVEAMISGDSSFTAAEKEEMKRAALESVVSITKRIDDFFTKELDLAKVIEEITIPIYDKNFTDAELRDFVAFYRSSAGQKAIALMPKLTAEIMAGFTEKVGPKLRDFLQKTAADEYSVIKQKLESQKQDPPKPRSKS